MPDEKDPTEETAEEVEVEETEAAGETAETAPPEETTEVVEPEETPETAAAEAPEETDAPPTRPPAPVIQALEPDEVEQDFDAAITAVNEDLDKSESDKIARRAELKSQKQRYRRDRENDVRQAMREQAEVENRARDDAAREHGVSRSVLDTAWAAACKDVEKKLGRGSRDAALMLLPQKIAAAKAAKKPPAKKPVPQVRATATGARLSPPGGAGAGRISKPKQTPEEAFDNGNWQLPN